jgi:tetratricopeptide (TPR) repeat protein
MAAATNTLGTPYERVLEGYRKLHALTLAGRDQTDEADAVREELDEPWERLTPEERERIGGLSEDLYSLSDPLPVARRPDPQADANLDKARALYRSGRYDEALNALRPSAAVADPAEVSLLRGRIWQALGSEETAVLFITHAASLRPAGTEF